MFSYLFFILFIISKSGLLTGLGDPLVSQNPKEFIIIIIISSSISCSSSSSLLVCCCFDSMAYQPL